MVEPMILSVSSQRHDPKVIKEFLDGEFRQVWAVDRWTSEPHYLPEGQAQSLREVAKRDWRCPYPGCFVRITTVGPAERRHHFRHDEPFPHKTDKESEFHLAAKAMLAEWARTQVSDAQVREEQTVKVPETHRHRRADVMATLSTGERVAFEVEYKAFDQSAWSDKHSDYEQQSVVVSWLFGHNGRYLTQPPRPVGLPVDQPWTMVRIRQLPRAVATHGLPVLHVNPVLRMVGTVLVTGDSEDDRPDWWRKEHLPTIGRRLPREGDQIGHLHVDALDDCRLDPTRGLMTPAMDEVWAEQADRRLRAEALQQKERERLQQPGPRRVVDAPTQGHALAREEPSARRTPSPGSTAGGAPIGPGGLHHHCSACAYRWAMGLPVTNPPGPAMAPDRVLPASHAWPHGKRPSGV